MCSKMTSLIVCIAGKNEIAVNALYYLYNLGWRERLLVCVNRTDKGKSDWQPSLLYHASRLGVRVVDLETLQEIENLVFISLEFDRIIQPDRFKSNRLYNIHFSALPAYKGMYTSSLPILHGADFSGVTLHEIDFGIDTGPIISQVKFAVQNSWTARDLYFTYMEKGFDLFVNYFNRLVDSELPKSTPQPAHGSTYFSKNSIDYKNVVINLENTAECIVRQLRAFSFREYQTPIIHGMEIGEWRILPERSRLRPGKIVKMDDETITISTIDYNLSLSRSKWAGWFKRKRDYGGGGPDKKYIDVRNIEGRTPLIEAVLSMDIDWCRFLLNHGANPNIGDVDGVTPLCYCETLPEGKIKNYIKNLLIRSGAQTFCENLFFTNFQ